MKTYRRKKSLKVNVAKVILTVITILTLTGCQEENTSTNLQSASLPALIKETQPSLAIAQLESQVEFNEKTDTEASRASYEDIKLQLKKVGREMMKTKYENMPTYNTELKDDTWKKYYDGPGVPLFRIAF